MYKKRDITITEDEITAHMNLAGCDRKSAQNHLYYKKYREHREQEHPTAKKVVTRSKDYSSIDPDHKYKYFTEAEVVEYMSKNPVTRRQAFAVLSHRVKTGLKAQELPEHITCPHCNKSGLPAFMRRWHFDNCKLFTAVVNSTNQEFTQPTITDYHLYVRRGEIGSYFYEDITVINTSV